MERQETDRPASLLVAAALVGLEGLALVVFGVVELAHLDSERKALAVTTALFFVAIGAGLAYCGRGLVDLQSWARGPTVVGQLIGLLVAANFWGGETSWIALVLGAVCLGALVGTLHPASTAALASEDYDEG